MSASTQMALLLLLVLLAGPGAGAAQEGGSAADAVFVLQKSVVAGGGVRSMGASGFELGATAGQPAAGMTAGSAAMLNAGFWNACLAEVAAVPEPSITTDGTDVELSWLADSVNAAYEIWVTIEPYFEPEHPDGREPIVQQETIYLDPGWAMQVANHFYILRGLNACGAASGDSDRVGEFTFGLIAGT